MTQSKKEAPSVELYVQEKKIGSYTTLLQSGILLECSAGQAIGIFINSLPGFDMDYIVNRIQTIFLDGNAIDDMKKVFTKTSPVLALSAAMPGLAGAIFRKNSLTAALRTSGAEDIDLGHSGDKILICLKLFNMIATEKGPGILENGGLFSGSSLLDFFLQRPSLKLNITQIKLDNTVMTTESFWSLLVPEVQYHLTIKSHKDI